MKTKISFLIMALSFSAMAAEPPAFPLQHHIWNPDLEEVGYVLGYLNNVQSSGIVIKTLDGEVQVGYESSVGAVLDHGCINSYQQRVLAEADIIKKEALKGELAQTCRNIVNPWKFSSLSSRILDQVGGYKDTPVLIYYKRFHYYPLTKSDNIVEHIFPVNPNSPVPSQSESMLNEYYFAKHFHYTLGVREGRIVKASLSKTVRSTYEVLIQEGRSGNQFEKMSVAFNELYDYIIKAMATGKLLRIYFMRLYSIESGPESLIEGYETPFRIYRVDIIDDKSKS